MSVVTTASRPRVLVVEPDDDVSGPLVSRLSEAGFAVTTVADHPAALELLHSHWPAILVMDVRLPLADTWSFLSRYRRESASSTATVVLMGDLDDGEIDLSLFGACCFIRKPIDLSEVLRAIGSCMAAT